MKKITQKLVSVQVFLLTQNLFYKHGRIFFEFGDFTAEHNRVGPPKFAEGKGVFVLRKLQAVIIEKQQQNTDNC